LRFWAGCCEFNKFLDFCEDAPCNKLCGSTNFQPMNLINFWTFCEDAPCNKLCGSTNFVFFGLMDQKLWVFEVFKRSLGSQKTFYFLTFLGWVFYLKFLTKSLIIPSS
jgi:hypothetical protein